MSASQHLQALCDHARQQIFDYALVNTAPVSRRMKERYAEERAEQVECDVAAIEKLGVRCVAGNFVEENAFARHATDRLCRELLRLAESARLAALPVSRQA